MCLIHLQMESFKILLLIEVIVSVGFSRHGNQGPAFQVGFHENVDRDTDTQKFNTNHVRRLPASYVHAHIHRQTPKGTLLPVVKINVEKADF